jgi:hypothetical protein
MSVVWSYGAPNLRTGLNCCVALAGAWVITPYVRIPHVQLIPSLLFGFIFLYIISAGVLVCRISIMLLSGCYISAWFSDWPKFHDCFIRTMLCYLHLNSLKSSCCNLYFTFHYSGKTLNLDFPLFIHVFVQFSKMSSSRNFVNFMVAQCLSSETGSQTGGKLLSFASEHQHYGEFKPIIFHPPKPGTW